MTEICISMEMTGVCIFISTVAQPAKTSDVVVKSVDCSQSSREMEDLQNREADRNWHWFRVGLGGSDAFVSLSSQRNLDRVILYLKSTVHT